MYDEVETVKGLCYFGDRLNASGGCEAAVTARTRVGWKKQGVSRDYILFADEMKGIKKLRKISYVIWSETWV